MSSNRARLGPLFFRGSPTAVHCGECPGWFMVRDGVFRGGVHDGDCVTGRVGWLADRWGDGDAGFSGEAAFGGVVLDGGR
jgi:hypothetical protein